MNTAATLWGSAAVGACAGAGLIGEAVLATLFVLASNTLLRPVVNRINRQPLQEKFTEATYTVYVICQRAKQAEAREEILALLEAASYPFAMSTSTPLDKATLRLRPSCTQPRSRLSNWTP